ncbi:hypothetical protein RFI_14426 [Reticulomyxa filosa]|uniref:SP-RING-type domain-containing protein n=1 Tax=Reticulomyxa filosa TaxID=46433 RepID=X6NBR7_RETFI|nr:hypothetical protein RFI_14426 [Reticulomyxa filosa]|eukprot:ETO22767.1 hypothetical protein RFI_14426 [Reticulomyxa filosa]
MSVESVDNSHDEKNSHDYKRDSSNEEDSEHESVTLTSYESLQRPLIKIVDDWQGLGEKLESEVFQHIIDAASSLSENPGQDHPVKTEWKKDNKFAPALQRLIDLQKEHFIDMLTYQKLATQIAESQPGSLNGINWGKRIEEIRNEVLVSNQSEINRFHKNKISSGMASLAEASKLANIDQVSIISNESAFDRSMEKDIHSDEEMTNDDLSVLRNRRSEGLNCPLTTKRLVHPYRGDGCRHVFERDAVFHHIQTNNQKNKQAECPLPGCRAILTRDNMRRCLETEKRLQHADARASLQRLERRDSQSGRLEGNSESQLDFASEKIITIRFFLIYREIPSTILLVKILSQSFVSRLTLFNVLYDSQFNVVLKLRISISQAIASTLFAVFVRRCERLKT